LLLLATVTGWVDAIGFTRLFQVFPANQSGNMVLFGISVGNAGRHPPGVPGSRAQARKSLPGPTLEGT